MDEARHLDHPKQHQEEERRNDRELDQVCTTITVVFLALRLDSLPGTQPP
jgi:hypothetical protein